MESSNLCSTQEFVDKSNAIINAPFQHGYLSISAIYAEHERLERVCQNNKLANALDIASRVCSMKLAPESPNEPFRPSNHNLQVVVDDFTAQELVFIESVYADITDELVKARFADLLWLCINPRKINYARTAIQNYLLLPIDSETWNPDIGDCWRRCIQLAHQINDKDSVKKVSSSLKAAFEKEYQNSPFMNLWIAEVIESNNLLKDQLTSIAEGLFYYAVDFCSSYAYHIARDYLFLAERIFRIQGEQDSELDCLLLSAESYEHEGDAHSYGNRKNAIAANLSYESALQAYRRVPKAKRNDYGITEKLDAISKRITVTGQNLLSKMVNLKIATVDISVIKANSIAFVKGKESLDESLLYFTGLVSPKYQQSRIQAIHNLDSSFFNNLFSRSHVSHDGRTIAKTPSLNVNRDSAERELAIYNQAVEDFRMSAQLIVEGQIVPALHQILLEFRITKEYLEKLCYLSPIVPRDREYLMSSALWSGFEYDFRNCIHLLAPQVEHLIRTKLKDSGVNTSHIDVNGIENEKGLSSLLSDERAKDVLGEDLLFELQALFTESIGANLRNEVAHGLLNDQNSESYAGIYAWWVILKLIVRSLYNFQITRDSNS